MLHRGKHLFDPELCAKLAQLLTWKLGTIIGHQVSWDPKMADNVSPHSAGPCGRLSSQLVRLLSTCEVLNRYHEILHLTNRQKERTQDVYSPCMERLGAMYWSQLLGGCVMPINMLLTLFASLCIPHAVLPHSWSIVPSSNDLQGESSPFDVASTNVFMELFQDTGALIPTHTSGDRMSVATVHQGIPSCVPLDRLCLCGLCQEHTINKVALVWHNPGLHYIDL